MRTLRLKAVQEKTGLTKQTIANWEREGVFPRRLRLGPNIVGWLESEIDEWIAARVALRDEIGHTCDAE